MTWDRFTKHYLHLSELDFALDISRMKFSDDFTKLPDRGRVYGKGHIDLYKSVASDLNNKKSFYVTKDDCLASIKLLHSFYLSDEKSSWVKLNKKIKSKRLGRPNEKISSLYIIGLATTIIITDIGLKEFLELS